MFGCDSSSIKATSASRLFSCSAARSMVVPLSSTSLTASNSPVSSFRPRKTRPNAPVPSSSPRCQRSA